MADTSFPPYTREALVRDLVRTISVAEGKGFNLGTNVQAGNIDRAYITDVTEHAIGIVNQLYIKTS